MDVAIIPRALLHWLEPDPERILDLDVLLSSVFLLVCAASFVLLPDLRGIVPHVCLARSLCGIPCPGCGVTGSALALVGGDCGRAWALNPGGVVLCATLALQIPLRVLALRRPRSRARVARASRGMTVAVLVGLAATWLSRIV